MAVSRRAWIVPLPSTFSNSAGGAYGHTAGNRRTWQTQKAGTGVNKTLYRMYLSILFFEKTQVSKFISCRVQFCVLQQPFFFVEVFLSWVFNVLVVVVASKKSLEFLVYHQVMPSVGCSTCPSLTSLGSPTEATQVDDGWGDVYGEVGVRLSPGNPVTFKGHPWLQVNSHLFSAIERGIYSI